MSSQSSPLHDEVENYLGSEAGPNAGAGDFDIAISIPEVLEIKMVDASAISDYEIWFFSCSSFLTFFTGFAVAWFQEKDERASKILLTAGLIFLVLFLGAFAVVLMKRRVIHRKSRVLKVKGQRVVELGPPSKGA